MDPSPVVSAMKSAQAGNPQVGTTRQKLLLEHEPGEMDHGMEAMLQVVSGAAVAMAVEAIASGTSTDVGSVSGAPGGVSVEIDADGRAAVFVDVDVTNAEAGIKRTVTVA
ncbi:hypothetical protein GP486_008824, partial [Trichoglossum hirsutum]